MEDPYGVPGAYGDRMRMTRDYLPQGFQLTSSNSGQSYQILQTLGGGGFGVTYEAVRLADRARVAIKEFFPAGITARTSTFAVAVTGDEKILRKRLDSFFKEAEVLRTLRAIPSVVNIYDIFYANHTAYYAMEYINGSTMQHFIQQNGLLAPAVFGPRYRQLMRDIELLHSNGVIHRDISPDNIMIRNDGSFKLIDFGSAKEYDKAQNMTVNIKRGFSPIEQYTPSGQGRYTDVYSLAATMYYSFTGKLIPDVLSRDTAYSQLQIAAAAAGLGPAQIEALKKALSVKPADRFQTMQEFEQAFFDAPKNVAAVSGQVHQTEPEKTAQGSRFSAALALIKDEPVFPILAGALYVVAVLLQIFL